MRGTFALEIAVKREICSAALYFLHFKQKCCSNWDGK